MLGNNYFIKIFNALPLPSLLVMPDAPYFTIAGVNAAYLAATGTNEGDLMGNGLFKAFPDNPYDHAANGVYNLTQSLLTVINTGSPQKMATQKYDIPIRGTDKFALKYWEPQNIPVFDDQGNLSLIIHTVKDVTEKTKLRLSEANKEREQLQRIMDTSLDIVCTINKNAEIIKVNAAAERTWGYAPSELEGKGYDIIMYPDDLQATLDASAIVMGGEINNNFENRNVRKDGSVVHMLWSAKWDEETQLMYCIGRDVTERKKAELEIKLMLDNTEEAFVLLDRALGIVSFNNQFANNYAMAGQEIKAGVSILEYSPSEKREALLALYSDVLNGKEASKQAIVPLPDGTEKVYSIKYKPARDRQQGVIGVFISTTDITEKEQALQQARESNKRYEYVTRATSSAIWDWDLVAKTIFWGEGFETSFGYKIKDLKKDISSWTDYLHPEEIEGVLKGIYEVIDGQQTNWNDHYRYLKADGSYAYVSDKGFVIRDENGKAIRMVGSMRDITSAKQTEQHLKLLESVVTNTNDSIIITEAEPFDEPGPRIIYVNDAFTKMTGYTSDEVIGKTPRILQGPKSDKEELKKLSIALRNWQPCEITTINYKKTGEEFWINFSISPVADETGWFTHWISIERDVTERKQFEIKQKEAIEQQALFVSIVNSSDDAIISTSLDSTITSWNKGAEKIFGYTQIEAVGKHISLIVPVGLLAEEAEIVSQIKKGKSVEHYETERLKKDGSHINVSITVSPIFDSKGNVVGASKITRDITEKKKAEDAIHKINERYNMVAKATNDAIWELDLVTGNVTRTGNGFTNMFGYPAEAICSRDAFFSLIHPDDLAPFKATQQAVFSDPAQSYWEHEYRFLKANGKYAYVCGKGFIVRSPQGKAIQMIGVTQDITLQKEHINKVLRIQQNLDSLINNTKDLIWSIDKEGKIIAVNAAFSNLIETLTGEKIKEGDVISSNAFPPEVLQAWDAYYQRAFEGESFSIGESVFNPQTGKMLYSIVSFSPIRGKDGVVTGVACLSKDITELKTASQKLIEVNAQLEKKAEELTVSNKELEHFAFIASHDLQEPLRMVTSFLSLLEKRHGAALDETGKNYIAHAVDGAKRMRQIILDLLEFSRVGRTEESTQDINLQSLVNETLGLLKSQIEEKQATIEIGQLPTIHAPKVLVRQVFMNIINNALKYTNAGVPAHIKINCDNLASYWQFSISDNGIGIKENYYERIFVIFQRLHNKDVFSGTGIGLAVTKKIIATLGGKIWVASKEGEGSTFYFTILKNR